MDGVPPTSDSIPQVRMPCDIELDYSDRVNFAMQQNGVRLVDSVRVTLRDDAEAEDVTVELTLDNGEAEPWVGRFARLEPDRPVVLQPDGFVLSARSLALRSEAEVTAIACRVRSGERQAVGSFPVDVLAFDHWPGVGHWPELTAAFVTPNHPRIAELLGAAREAMREISGADALDGYQSGSRQRAAQLAEACFNAAAARGIGYITPPASFETAGQRVRLVDRVVSEKLGTCLDLSLLLMSQWEQCGLHSLLLLPEGHAMPAVWTHDAHLPEAVIDEPSRIRNLVELGEVVPVESTVLTHDVASFHAAVDAATRRLREPGGSFCAVDIRSARKRGVRPLPLRASGDTGINIDEIDSPVEAKSIGAEVIDRVALADRAEQSDTLGEALGGAGEPAEEPGGRIARWQTRLLDLSLRNRLLNYRASGRTLALAVPDLANVEDALADGGRFEIYPKAESSVDFLRDEVRAGHLYAEETAAETSKRLLKLYRIAKSSIEETGANVLYLALGMLKWYESETADKARLAPLVLLPIALARKSTGAGYAYSISLTDEPLRPNVTLLEKLRSEFGIDTASLDDLPEDEHGLDVDLILRNVRSVIRASKRWEVVENASIGLFSFNKFLMWRDLKDNLDNLRTNRLVEHLVERPGEDFDAEPFPKPEELDDRFGPNDLLCTRDADSSQLAAVRAAAEGRSFVLEGPPGTGKSQTISNIIANSLANGQRVLFVAEKMAALSVVRKRLERDGLGPFCLELHSAKASKKEVLAQLEEALSADSGQTPADWTKLCEDLSATRNTLNEYVREMHERRPIGESLYQMLGRISVVDNGPSVAPPSGDLASTSEEQFSGWLAKLDSLQHRARPVDPVGGFPLCGIGCSAWSFSLPDEARRGLESCAAALSGLTETTGAMLRKCGSDVQAAHVSHGAAEAIASAAAMLRDCPAPPLASLVGPDASGFRARAGEAVAIGSERDSQRAKLLSVYREEFLDVEHLGHIDALKRHLDRNALMRFFTAGGVKKKLRVFARGELPPLETVLDDLEAVSHVKRATSDLERFNDIEAAFGDRWIDRDTDWADRAKQLEWGEAFGRHIKAIELDRASSSFAVQLAECAVSEEQAERVAGSAAAVVEAWNEWSEAWEALASVLVTTVSDAAAAGDGDTLGDLARTLGRWRDHLSELNTWVTWRAARDEAVESGLGDIVELYERGGCERDDLYAVFVRSFGRPWFNAVADSVDAVRSFNAASHGDSVDRFRDLDSRCIRATRGVVAAKLAERAPAAPTSVSSQSEVGILRRELAKKRRHLPTRRLIEAMPTLLPRLKPCFLMSPLSVAQFLDSTLPRFDLVVFDEASQIPVWDAIGAIARGAEVIVVGDSKQLPPTSFFSTIDGDDEFDPDDHAVEDTESILKECNASGVPGLRLQWHYRSRHETLIAFSNHHYYENELHTFPSPQERSERLGVTFQHVEDGVYDRGASRTNRIEAERVVAEIVRQLLDPSSDDSIGVVTFNQAQQSLIEDLLDAERRAMPELERFFTNEVEEPVFVKNLENVQGDERDAIIFSVGYGPDHTGRPSMNFGPLNKEGGERRLNVAITRAKRRLIVFSSLTSDQIDLKRTRAVGVRDFKAFLDYANRGPEALVEVSGGLAETAASGGIEESVRSALMSLGWEVDTRVGCAGYRIDLAVRHPSKPDEYVLGIECDGATYRHARTARDRDRTRHAVLVGLGWRLERVWSVEWHINAQGCISRLSEAIERSLAGEEPDDPEQPGTESAAVEPEAAEAIENEMTGATGGRGVSAKRRASFSSPVAGPQAEDAPSEASDVYRVAKFRRNPLGRKDVYGDAAMSVLPSVLVEIVQTESPILVDLAQRRLADACRVKSIRERFRERFDAVLAQVIRSGEVSRVGDDLWLSDQSPSAFTIHRVPGDDDDSTRDLNDVPVIEIRNAAYFIVQQQFGLPREELVRETAGRFGVQRVTARIVERIEPVVVALVQSGDVVEHDGFVRLPTSE
ncbi:MAG: DUF4011 domain-containing protein [Planctomycetota bacterium]